ncbi:uroporphyrinogen-III C-methyltransferase [Sinirhodobacter populi]|uniref:uroporphyrinogen-III C-methyltransferase n=1 Tax=Paenirhodobacter populi TaxID=2306993 RepID=A0A443K3E8_9RHOB|nr:uroporphyrinogen-III C-methyltransferase [Sinirhodobacter populi]RWR27288.1 uroporphyrinogen-III C-methyltransferase [Sinirhodobacter populi]
MTRKTGSIALVGAGPGAADLLTLRALDRLRAADVVYYDRLVDPAVLDLIPPHAERIFVGKEVGRHAWPQARIDRTITAAARAGRRVVRLKSGDPGIFGRAGEELAAAHAAGIPVEIVPGITAASAAAASLGQPLTERGQTDHLVIATGTCRPGDEAPDWGALLVPGTTLALYMAMGKLAEVEVSLRAAGMPSSTGIDMVSEASTGRERRLVTTLGRMRADVAASGLTGPAIIFVRRPKPADTALALIA